MHPVNSTTVLADDIEEQERKDPNAFYGAKLITVRHMQKRGTPDAMIERLLGITIRPEHRNPEPAERG